MNIETFASRIDLLGMLVFSYIIIYAFRALRKERNFWNWILLLIAMGGFLVDFFIVVNTYF